METNPNTNQPLTKEEIQMRFAEIRKKGVKFVPVWRMNLKSMEEGSYWWTVFNEFLKQ